MDKLIKIMKSFVILALLGVLSTTSALKM